MLDANVSAPDDNRTVMEMAQQYAIYSAAMWISKYYLPVLVPIGLVGNTLAFLVMRMPHNRANSCCNFMAALSMSDNCMMVTAVYLWVVSSGFARSVTFYECKAIAYAFNSFSDIGIYLIVFMTFDRFIAVRFPLKMSTLCTVRRARITIVAICIAMLLYCALYFYTSGIINDSLCSAIKEKTLFAQTFSWVNVFISSVVPFCSLLAMNVVIIKTIINSGKNLNKQTSKKDKGNSEKQLAMMLIMVSIAFLFLTLPICIRYTLAVILDHANNPYHNAVYSFVYHLSQKLYFTNNAVNFYLYCIGGAKFRADLAKLCGRKRRKEKYSHSVSDEPTVWDTHL